MEDLQAPVTGLLGALAVAVVWLISKGGPPLLDFIRQRKQIDVDVDKQKVEVEEHKAEIEGRRSKEKNAAFDYLVKQYRKLAEDLQRRFDRVQEEIDALQAEHMRCREENAALKAQVTAQQERIVELHRAVEALRHKAPEGGAA